MVEIEHSVANNLTTAATFLIKKLYCLGAMTRRWALQTCYILWRYTGSTVESG